MPQTTALGARGMVIQRRFLLGPFFKLARSGFALAAGAAAGGAAYTHHKFSEATSSIGDKLGNASEWAQGVWDKFEIPDFGEKGVTIDPTNTEPGAEAGSNSGGSEGSGSSGGSGGPGGAGNSGGSGGPDSATLASAMASLGTPDSDNSYEDQLYDMDDQMINLTKKMIEIRNILLQIDGSDKVQLPSIVVIGSQSSGKSSVLEAIVGHEFLPKGSNMVTRRPIELTLVHSSGAASEYCEFPALRLGQITNFREVQRTLSDLNRAVPDSEVVSDEPIQLRIHSPHVPDLTLIDLPGYIQVVAADQPLELKSRIAALCEKYIQAPNVILAVSAADVDLANSTALRASRRVDPLGQRTIGVISKMDLVDSERGVATLNTREYPLRMGYVGVVTKLPSQGGGMSIFGGNQNMTKSISESERRFFGANKDYETVTWGVLQLRQKLMRVLEKSMAESLEPTKRAIKRELEETSYRFKVQYNDRVLTPHTYLAQCADAFKVGFQDLSTRFGRDQVRELIKQSLDQKVLDLLAETYWNSPPEVLSQSQFYGSSGVFGGGSTDIGSSASLADLASPKPDMLLWQSKVDQLSATITKLGIGRLSTSILVEAIEERMKALEASSSFKNHPLALEQIDQATEGILNNKFYATADQIENSIKPYKYEVDIDSREWKQSREYAYSLLQEELRQCDAAYNTIKEEVGSSKLNKLIKSLHAVNPAENLDHFSTSLLSKARVAAFLKERAELLRARSVFIKSTKCKSSKNKALCPEVFMDVVASKLAATAVLFLNFELLSDFYYSFPREFDAKLLALSEEQVETLATQDPAVKRHVDLQHRKELLQLALSKLQTISEMRNMES